MVRGFAYVYHAVLALFLLTISGMALATDAHSLQLEMLPWKGSSLTYWLFFGALFGLVSIVLAARRILPALFLLWSLIVFVILVKGYIFSGYYFDPGEFRRTVYLIIGALVSVIGAWFAFTRLPRRS